MGRHLLPILDREGFHHGFKDRSIFCHPWRDVVDLTYGDDNYLDDEEDEVTWATYTINTRFDCKDLEWVPTDHDGDHIGYLGMPMSMDSERTFLEMYVKFLRRKVALEVHQSKMFL